METMTRVLIADVDDDFRHLFAEILNHEKRTECVGDTGNGAEALRLAEELKPDLLVLDLALPELDGEGLLKLFTLAHASGARTALDMRVSEREYDHALLEACFRKTDYFLPSEREAVWLTGETGSPEKMAQALHKMGAANCVIKLGAQGCYVSADGIEAHIPAFPCRCVDTTGAGDTFVGSFLYAKSQGWDTLASARFACAAGSVAVEHVGANTAIRSKDQVLARMNGQ